MSNLLRVSALREYVRAALWVVPSVAIVVSVALGVVLTGLEPPPSILDGFLFGGSPEGARGVLSAIAGSMITVTSLTFSLTVLALQMASSQFSPRLLRTFLRDRANQATLATFLSAFAFSLVVLRTVRSAQDGTEAFVPDLAVTVAIVLALVAVGMLVFFIHHLTQQLRVESVMARVERDTLEKIDEVHPRMLDPHDRAPVLPAVPPSAHRLRALRSGIVQGFDGEGLCAAAEQQGAVVLLRAAVGSHVSAGATIAWAWPDGEGRGLSEATRQALEEALGRNVQVGFERTMQEDVAFGLRQLVDIVSKALSPGINDPTTAVGAIGHLASLLCVLVQRGTGPKRFVDGSGRLRVGVAAPGFADLLAIAMAQPRRYGAREPDVLLALAALLVEVAECARTDDQREVIAEEVARLERVALELDVDEGAPVVAAVEEARAAVRIGHRTAALAPSRQRPVDGEADDQRAQTPTGS